MSGMQEGKNKRDSIVKEERKKLSDDFKLIKLFNITYMPIAAPINLIWSRNRCRIALMRNPFITIHWQRYKTISDAMKSACDMNLSSLDIRAAIHEAHLKSFAEIQPALEGLFCKASDDGNTQWASICYEMLLKIQQQYIDRIVDINDKLYPQ